MVEEVDALMVARFLFERQAMEFGAAPEEIEGIWNNDAHLRAFLTSEATALLEFIGFAKATK